MNSLIVLVSVCCVLVSFILFSKAAGSISLLRLNTVSYVLYFQLVPSAVIGSVLVATKSVDYHYMIVPISDKIKILGWVGVMYSIIAMPVAMIIFNYFLKLKIKPRLYEYINAPLTFTTGKVLTKVILSVMVLLSFVVLIYILKSNKEIPLLTLLKGDILQAAEQRVTVRREFGGIIYIKNLLGFLLIPVFTYYSYIQFYYNRSTYTRIVFTWLLCCTIILLFYDIQKAPVVFFLMGFIIIQTFIKGGVSKRSFFLFIFSGLLLISLGFYLTSGSSLSQIFNLKSGLWSRIFISSYGGYVLSLELFPNVITQPTWQIGIPSFILEAFDLPTTESARLLMMHVRPEGVRDGSANLISSYYLGEAWANYGIIGILTAPFVVGVVVQSVHIYLLKHKKEPLILAFYTYITTHWLLMSGYVNLLYLKQLIFPVFFYFLIKIIIKETVYLSNYVKEKNSSC